MTQNKFGYAQRIHHAACAVIMSLLMSASVAGGSEPSIVAPTPFQVTELDNGTAEPPAHDFVWEDLSDPKLTLLRETFRIDEVVAGSRTQFEAITRIAAWASRQFVYGMGGPSGKDGLAIIAKVRHGQAQGRICGSYGVMMQGALASLGIMSRALSCGTQKWPDPAGGKPKYLYHAVTDVWSDEHGKWVYMDGNFGVYFVADGVPMSVSELQAASLAGHGAQSPHERGIHMMIIDPESHANIQAYKPDFDAWLRDAYDRLKLFYHVDVLYGNNLHNPDWRSSKPGNNGPLRVWLAPTALGYDASDHLYLTTWEEKDPTALAIAGDAAGFEFVINDVRIAMAPKDDETATLTFNTYCPQLKHFELHLDDRTFRLAGTSADGVNYEASTTWQLSSGRNTCTVRTVNRGGTKGRIRRIVLSNSQSHVAPVHAATSAGGSCVAWDPLTKIFYESSIRNMNLTALAPEKTSIRLQRNAEAKARKRDGVFRLRFTPSGGVVTIGHHWALLSRADGSPISELRSTGSGEFQWLGGVTIDNGRIYLTEDDHSGGVSRVQVFSEDGRFLYTFGEHGRGRGELNMPAGIDVVDKRVYVADAGNDRVVVFSLKGRYMKTFGPDIKDAGRLSGPSGITCTRSPNGQPEIHVADTMNARVVVLDERGRFLRQYGRYGSRRHSNGDYLGKGGTLLMPRTVAIGEDTIQVSMPPYRQTFRQP